ncbi:protein of unknown function (DUF4265) [Micromonospora viridifaciens]|uniref:DUF4265 domain-containing protein n=1 Tax=Micromonospora viridifaciens TaxID=1881 RepID=A0A1C4V6Y3_MICVI|nr:DUF4265 domain-containing protein [Micromonospora viridifaciens]SCE79712.1 protein of unknown function (DUF4265) [Micromonospora viridifaciens]
MTAPAPGRVRPSGEQLIKIWFKFVPREGWLPYDTEGLWALAVGPDTARICNVPFLQDGVAEGDVVRFTTTPDGLRWATGRVEASGNCTVRVLPKPRGPLGPSAQAVFDRLAPFGLGGEPFSKELPLVALTVPASADLSSVKAALLRGEAEGWWTFEVGCATDEWKAA